MSNKHCYYYYYYYYYLIIWVFMIIIVKSETSSKSIYQVLESKGLPSGLFPKGISNFTIDDDGNFRVYLNEACEAKFESEIHYEKDVSGQISFGQIGNLTGIEAQDLFLWFPVKGIRVDIPSSGVIYFDVGVVHKQFSVSLFDTPRDCVATTRPIAIGNFDFSSIVVDLLVKKLDGILQYSLNWWKNDEAEVI
ncbi:uncharacterized protein LOC130800224 [Amaranthus tricolor]|uniref:uncharacterized protein LOC130800224 n=1 Tax=Amaranthus tricolor TaxID=29722 RepID=UPI002586C142|nr:uncharacterized protein LOC130800224 [Amaranthus tricolor]